MEFLALWGWLIVLLLGMGLLVLEMFLPGFSVAGISGALLVIAGIIWKAQNVAEGLLILLIVVAILSIALVIIIQSAAGGRLSRSRIVLRQRMTRDEGFTSNIDMDSFLGKEGTTLTPLRPAGTGDFDGTKLDVVSESEFVDQGAAIVVTAVEGRRIVVRSVPKA